SGNRRIKIIALESILKLLTPDIAIDSDAFHSLSLSEEQDVWIQSNAISILKYINPDLFKTVASKRLNTYRPDPDFFVRQHIVTLLDKDDILLNTSFIDSILNDPSEFVRQAFCQKIAFLPHEVLSRLMEDPAHQVRGLATLNTASL